MTVLTAADLVVVGGGLGGCAAALAAADAGLRVVLTEETDRVGGQVTSQLVSALDEHADVERFPGTATYGAFRQAVRDAYGGIPNPGGGWVSRLCFDPRVGLQVLDRWLVERGVEVRTGVRPVGTTVTGGLLREVTLDDGSAVRGAAFADATELGDLLPLAGADWVVGSEGPRYGERHALPAPAPAAVQSCTWCAVVEHVPGARFDPVPRPAGYERWKDRYTFEIAGWDGVPHRYRMFIEGPDGRPPFWTYRRLEVDPQIAVLNWVSNDYADASLVHQPQRAQREAREQTLGFVHWLQTQAPHDDGTGRGFPSLRLRPDVAGTPDGLAAAAYVRESRRLANQAPVTGHDLAPLFGRARALAMPDSVGVAHYHADLHPRVGSSATVFAETAPFQIPLRALVTDRPRNLLAAAKNLAATQVAAAAYRVHSGEWAVGEAAGTIAAQSVRAGVHPFQVRDDPGLRSRVQLALVGRGAAIAWTTDVPPGDDLFAATQLLAAAGGLAGRREETLDVNPAGPVDDLERAALHAAAVRLTGGGEICAPVRHRTWAEVVRHYGNELGLTTSPRSLT
jgi:hypothetical protein